MAGGDLPGAQLVNEPGAWSWSELITTDSRRRRRSTARSSGGAPTPGDGPGAYTEWQVNGRSVGGMMLKPPMMPAEVPPHWAVYFSVADTDAAAARVAELGGSLVMPPMDIEPGRFAVVSDPAGAVFNVITLRRRSPADVPPFCRRLGSADGPAGGAKGACGVVRSGWPWSTRRPSAR